MKCIKDKRVPEDRRRKWEGHLAFLIKPFTYILAHTLADFLEIHQCHTNDYWSPHRVSQGMPQRKLMHSDGDREEKTNQTSILRRAWTHRLKHNKKWMIHKALDGLSFTRACLAPYFDGTYIKQAGRPSFVFSRARHVLAFAHTYQRSYFGWHFYYKVGPHFFIVAGSDVGEA